ncbi:hypothetical protein PCE1_002898 [Barthelona sp. PCE]
MQYVISDNTSEEKDEDCSDCEDMVGIDEGTTRLPFTIIDSQNVVVRGSFSLATRINFFSNFKPLRQHKILYWSRNVKEIQNIPYYVCCYIETQPIMYNPCFFIAMHYAKVLDVPLLLSTSCKEVFLVDPNIPIYVTEREKVQKLKCLCLCSDVELDEVSSNTITVLPSLCTEISLKRAKNHLGSLIDFEDFIGSLILEYVHLFSNVRFPDFLQFDACVPASQLLNSDVQDCSLTDMVGIVCLLCSEGKRAWRSNWSRVVRSMYVYYLQERFGNQLIARFSLLEHRTRACMKEQIDAD